MALAAFRRRSTIHSAAVGDRASEDDEDDEDGDVVDDCVETAIRGVELERDERDRVLLQFVVAPSGEIGLLIVDNDNDLVLRGDSGNDFFVGDVLPRLFRMDILGGGGEAINKAMTGVAAVEEVEFLRAGVGGGCTLGLTSLSSSSSSSSALRKSKSSSSWFAFKKWRGLV
jgi:hypothetical protein